MATCPTGVVRIRTTASFDGKPPAVAFNCDRHPHLSAGRRTPLPAGYADRARRVAERRVVLAGLRLCDQLQAVLP